MKRLYVVVYAWYDWWKHYLDCLRGKHRMLRVATVQAYGYRYFGYYQCMFCSHREIAEDREVRRRVTPYISRQPVRRHYR